MSGRLILCLCARSRLSPPCNSRILSVAFLRSSSTSAPLPRSLIPFKSVSMEELGPSILLTQSMLPPGSSMTPHDLLKRTVRMAKLLSLSSSAVGLFMVPVLSSYLWEAASEKPSMMAFALLANSFLVLLSFTPFLLHFLSRRFPIDLHYNPSTQIFSTVHYNFFLQKKVRRFRAEDVVDPAVAPEMQKAWLPLATAFVHGQPLLMSLDRNAYCDTLAFDKLTRNINIPPNHD